ncbi:hypothetical protein EEB14_25650 [Rhodococcus sp. WS4]|nr:hypothetical protein EEB14_25650 [Rhodococcus sp. WS4]
MERHPGLLDPADIEPTFSPVIVMRAHGKPVDNDPDLADITLSLKSAQVDDEWAQLFYELPGDRRYGAYLVHETHRASIGLRVRNDDLEVAVAELRAAITELNTKFTAEILPERQRAYEQRQAEKSVEKQRQAALNEVLDRVNDQL